MTEPSEKDREEARKLWNLTRRKMTSSAMDIDDMAIEISRIRAEAFEAGRADIEALLKNPDAVYVNYLRGSIDASSIIKAEVAHQVEAARAEERKLAERDAVEDIIRYCHEAGHYEVHDALVEYLEKQDAILSDDKAER